MFRVFSLIWLLWRDLNPFWRLLSEFFQSNAGFENVANPFAQFLHEGHVVPFHGLDSFSPSVRGSLHLPEFDLGIRKGRDWELT